MFKLFFRRWRAWGPYVCFMIVAGCLLLPQLYHHAVFYGYDGAFHNNRFYDAMMQLKSGHFEPAVTLYGFGQSGRIVNAVYGPGMAYAQGGLLWLAGSWLRYQLLVGWLLNLSAGTTFYILLRRHQLSRKAAIIFGCAFMVLSPSASWQTAQTFTAFGAAFFPLVLLAGSRLFQPTRRLSVWPPALVMTLLIQTHMVTALLASVMYGTYVVVACWQRSDWRLVLRTNVLAGGLTLLLTANVWAGLAELRQHNQTIGLWQIANPELQTFTRTLWISGNKVDYGAWLVVIVMVVIAGLAAVTWSQLSRLTQTTVGLAAGLTLLSSPLLPWQFLFRHVSFLADCQFPSRFFIPVVALLLFALALLSQECTPLPVTRQTGAVLLITATLLMALIRVETVNQAGANFATVQTFKAGWPPASGPGSTYYLGGNYYVKAPFRNGNAMRRALSDKQNGLKNGANAVIKGTTDYLPTNRRQTSAGDYNAYVRNIWLKPNMSKTVHGSTLTVTWQQATAGECQLPVVAYANTKIRLNGHTISASHYTIDAIGAVHLRVPAGHNQLTLRYHPHWWYTASWWLAAGTAVLSLLAGSYTHYRRRP